MPTQRGTTTTAKNTWGTGFTIARPTGLQATDVTELVIFAETPTDPDWTVPGFDPTPVVQAVAGTTFTLTVLRGTGVSGAGTFAPSSPSVGSSTWVAMSASSWDDADYDNIIAGTPAAGGSPGGTPIVIPGVTTTEDNAVLTAVGLCQFSTASMAPAMSALTTDDAQQHARTIATAGATGDTTNTENNPWNPYAWVHIAIQPPSADPPAEASVSGTITWGPGSVTSVAQHRSSIAGAVNWGPGIVTTTATHRAAVTGAVNWGPGTVTARTEHRAAVAGSVSWGPGVVTTPHTNFTPSAQRTWRIRADDRVLAPIHDRIIRLPADTPRTIGATP